ncbi:MAG: glutathione S-transferase family protein [Alphaproteobacteria bacterium]|nr:glutathione S-transferase family protein [Alphaproteobacteria bacterium]
MIDLYTASTGNGRRAAIALEECGLPYTVHKLDLGKGDVKKPEFLKINPAGAIPAIVDPDGPGGKKVVLAQSGAIVLYAAEKSGKFIPKDPAKRAEAYQWFMQATTDVAPTSSSIFYISTHVPVKDPANTGYFEQRFLTQLGIVDKQLEGKEYLVGECSIADLALYPVITARKAMVDAAPGLANVKAWAARMAARPAIAKAMANNG